MHIDAIATMLNQYEADKALPDPASLPEPGAPMPFSVLLLYPDYLTDEAETFYTHVLALDVDGAIAAARAECMAVNMDEEDAVWEGVDAAPLQCKIDNPDDLRVLLVTRGHAYDCKYESTRFE